MFVSTHRQQHGGRNVSAYGLYIFVAGMPGVQKVSDSFANSAWYMRALFTTPAGKLCLQSITGLSYQNFRIIPEQSSHLRE
jgi:hypothetical protein